MTVFCCKWSCAKKERWMKMPTCSLFLVDCLIALGEAVFLLRYGGIKNNDTFTMEIGSSILIHFSSDMRINISTMVGKGV
jgi:hypothetical protein